MTRSTRPYSVNVGNPCREKYLRFTEEQIHLLTSSNLKWWDLPDDKIASLSPYLCSQDINYIINFLGKQHPSGNIVVF